MFKVFPACILPNGNKEPLIKRWLDLATDDVYQIEKWKQDWGSRLTHWGVPCGSKNNILVLDIDVKNKNGWDTIKQRGLEIPVTLSQRTISGGTHFMFKYPTNYKIGNRVGFMPGLDIRSEGGYILFYGLDFDPSKPLADAPNWLIEAGIKPEPTHDLGKSIFKIDPTIAKAMLENALDNIRNAPPGESNNTLNVEAYKCGQLIASGSFTREFIVAQLLQAAKDRGKPHRESVATIDSGIDGGLKNPMTCPFDNTMPVANIEMPFVSEAPKPWTPRAFTREDLNNVSMLRKPQLFRDWSTEDITITTADGGTGKTTLKLQEAICLALGVPFLGFHCEKPGKTLFITGEDTAEKLAAMLGQQLRQMGLMNGHPDNESRITTILDSIRIKKDADLCMVTKDRQGFLIHSITARDKVMQAVRDLQPKMIVFDPISSFWGPESQVNDMNRAVIKFVGELVESSGACVEMINHMGKVSSANKDMTQFAGRGGTGLPSNARVSRVLRPIQNDEYLELTGKELEENVSCMMCNVNKFTDGSPLFNKPFLILRRGYLFERQMLTEQKMRDAQTRLTDEERVFAFIKQCRASDKYPTQKVIIAEFMRHTDKIPKARVERAIQTLCFGGHMGEYVRQTEHPDQMISDKALIITDEHGKEL